MNLLIFVIIVVFRNTENENLIIMSTCKTGIGILAAFLFCTLSICAQNVGIGTTVPKSKLDVSGGLTVGSYAGSNAAPSNGAIISGNVGIGTASPNARLHVINSSNTDGLLLQNAGGGAGTATNLSFATYADIVAGTSRPGAKLTAVDDGNFSAYLSFYTKIPGADANAMTERMRLESAGDLRMENSSSIHMPSNVAYVVDRTTRTENAGSRGTVGSATNALPVETGDIITISATFKFKWTGGSGTDQPIMGISVTGCTSTTLLDSYQIEDADDIARGQYQCISLQYVYVATCTGNLQFALYVDVATNANDIGNTGDVVIVAHKY